MDSAAGLCVMTHWIGNTIAYLWRENVACIEPDMCHQQLGFKSGGSHHFGPGAMQERVCHGRKFDIVDL